MDRLNDIHGLFKAQRRNSCKMTEAEYAEKATQLLDILGDFEGLIAGELADAPSRSASDRRDECQRRTVIGGSRNLKIANAWDEIQLATAVARTWPSLL